MSAFPKPEPPAVRVSEPIVDARAARKTMHATDQACSDLQLAGVGGVRAELRVFGEMLADHIAYRISFKNRAESTGIGDSLYYSAPADTLRILERGFALNLVRAFRKAYPKHAAWAKATQGIGEHTVARLLAVTGHPRIAQPHHWEANPDYVPSKLAGRENPKRILVPDEPYLRNVAKFWAYCGHGDPTRKRAAGMTAEQAASLGNPHAKMLAHIIAECAFKQTGEPTEKRPVPPPRSPYRDVYDDAKAHYEDYDWTPLHKHNAALRKTAKAILKDLWLVEPAELAPPPATAQPRPNLCAPAAGASTQETT